MVDAHGAEEGPPANAAMAAQGAATRRQRHLRWHVVDDGVEGAHVDAVDRGAVEVLRHADLPEAHLTLVLRRAGVVEARIWHEEVKGEAGVWLELGLRLGPEQRGSGKRSAGWGSANARARQRRRPRAVRGGAEAARVMLWPEAVRGGARRRIVTARGSVGPCSSLSAGAH